MMVMIMMMKMMMMDTIDDDCKLRNDSMSRASKVLTEGAACTQFADKTLSRGFDAFRLGLPPFRGLAAGSQPTAGAISRKLAESQALGFRP